jgi:prepilin-type N-terminal cleavage/methylation domain-containing protein
MRVRYKHQAGFTIIELLIVIVVIAILAGITIVAYNGIQSQAKDSSIQSTIEQLKKAIEMYNIENGSYPVTSVTPLVSGGGQVTYSSLGCPKGTARSDWIPGLAQSPPQLVTSNTGVNGYGGCYMYSSDGTRYILSAWNMLSSVPQNQVFYRRIGFREMNTSPYYYCNHVTIGGNNPTPYTITKDYYKYSYTVSNITNCNETPPTGA